MFGAGVGRFAESVYESQRTHRNIRENGRKHERHEHYQYYKQLRAVIVPLGSLPLHSATDELAQDVFGVLQPLRNVRPVVTHN